MVQDNWNQFEANLLEISDVIVSMTTFTNNTCNDTPVFITRKTNAKN
jgi:hypothetical protein